MIGDTQVTICNAALGKIGEVPLADGVNVWPLTSLSVQTIWCSQFYDPCRREVLRQHLWNFAHVQVQIAASVTPPPFGWGNAFPLPADFMRFWDTWDGDDERFKQIGWKVIGQNIITDDSGPLDLDYVNDFQTCAQMDSLFVSCLAFRLAAELAVPLTKSQDTADKMMARYRDLLPDARLVASQENSAPVFEEDVWLASRAGF
jgi:hypothetical protein